MEECRFHIGDVVQHFKRENVNLETAEYLYRILAFAQHTENGEKLVIYQALYGEGGIFARPLEMFMEKTDKVKYPEALQEYRFELEEAEEKKSMLMEYLDLKTNEERLQFLQKRKADVTEAFLEAVAQSMDYTEKETSVELRLVDLMNYLRMLMKYERRM